MTILNLQQHLSLPATRREFLARAGTGLGSLGLASLLGTGAVHAAPAGTSPMTPRPAQFAGKAKHVIHIFLNGGPSHVDTFDPKPSLTKYNGQSLPTSNLPTERKTGAALASPFKFAKYGQSGIEVSELFHHTA